jgi:tetratricopeptide (TPR) repeat protein
MNKPEHPAETGVDSGPSWSRRKVGAVCGVLVLLTFAVFGQTLGFRFLNFDDPIYVYANPVVLQGLTWKGLGWAWTYAEIGHWHPLTWWSHMLDCQLYGSASAGPHLTNVLLQALAAVLLFLALREMTGNNWRSAVVAALFDIHPLRAESVAWIAERKDVLSGVFFMLTLWAYAKYARKPSPGRYSLVMLVFALGLLCKNTLVTMPCVLLLLDWWPLRRPQSIWILVREKIPLLLLSAGSCVATAWAPEKVFDADRVPLLERMGNLVVSYGAYLGKMIVPVNLAIPYLYPPHGVPWWQFAVAAAALLAISFFVWRFRRPAPYLAVGWLWYLGMLLPASGLVQISYYSHADRYTYLPGIGVALAVVWAGADAGSRWKKRGPILVMLTAIVLIVLMACAVRQTSYWSDSETLWRHTLACDSDNYVARLNLGIALDQDGNADGAFEQFQRAENIRPQSAQAQDDLGNLLREKGQVEQAIAHYRKGIESVPSFPNTHYDLAVAFQIKGAIKEAIPEYEKAIQLKSDYEDAHYNLATAFVQTGAWSDAASQYRELLQIHPGQAETQRSLAAVLIREGNVSTALELLRSAAASHPSDAGIANDLAWILATAPDGKLRNGAEAVALAQKACQLTGNQDPATMMTWAAALAETGEFEKAADAARQGLGIATEHSNTVLANQLREQLKCYESKRPFRAPALLH